MRLRLVLLAGAAFLAAVHVIGVLLGSPIWPLALVGALLTLAAAALPNSPTPAADPPQSPTSAADPPQSPISAADPPQSPTLAADPPQSPTPVAGPPRWLGPVALAPLILQAALTVPRVHTDDYAWFVTTFTPEPPQWVVLRDALDAGFRSAGAPLLFVAVILMALRPLNAGKYNESGGKREGGRGLGTAVAVAGMWLAGLGVLAYAAVRVVVLDSRDPTNNGVTFAAAVVVPVAFALVSAALAAVFVRRRRWWPVVGSLLLAGSALPMIDGDLDVLPVPYGVSTGDDPTRLFGWDLITPSTAVPGPMPALVAGLHLAGYLLLIGVAVTRSKSITPYGG